MGARYSKLEPVVGHDREVIDLIRRRSSPDDRASTLMVAVARGDEKAFAELYDLVVDRVYGVIKRVIKDPARSEEVTQEVMVEIWRTAPRFDAARGRAVTWMLTIAHRRAVDRVRSEQASRDRDERHGRSQPTTGPPSEVAVLEQIEAERVRRALDELTEPQRHAIEMAYFGGHSHAEIAALLELPLGTVKTRIRDGLIRLRDRMEVMT
jgi:RNA polymerase sigma-70 factor (ECF subfamily)